MTNKHCDDCGDPIFRYQGQEFCPTCGREVGTAADSEGGSAAADDAPETTADAGDGAETDDGVEAAASGGRPRTVDRNARSTPTADATPRVPSGTGEAGGDDLEAARAALVRTLASLARRAEATDDVGRARDLLAAAREAAEALAAVDGASH